MKHGLNTDRKKMDWWSMGVMGGRADAGGTVLRSKAMAGGGGQKAGSFRTGTMEKRVDLGKGGQEIGKWRSFSHFETTLTHLFPPFSTQVVDFPHLAMVSIFWGSPEMLATDETQTKHGCRKDGSIRKAGTEPSGAWNQGRGG